MKKSLTLLAAFTVLVSFELKSIIANPNPIITYDVNGNKVTLVLHGDESSKYAIVEENGMFAEVDSIGRWWYIELEKDDQIKISGHEVSASDVNSVKNELCIQSGTIMLREEMMKQDKRRRAIQYSYNSTSQEAVVGRRNALIVLAQFPDQNIICEQADFECLFNQPNYSENSATGSVYDYFYEISEGQLEIASNIIGPFMAKHPMSYYGANAGIGGNDTNPFALFSEAMEFAASSVSLSDYDCNGDGFIDNIHIIYAGYGEESGAPSNTIWAHEATFSPITINAELKIDRYSCSPELRGRNGNLITTIGPPCHEILHALGAMDFYDTDIFHEWTILRNRLMGYYGKRKLEQRRCNTGMA